MIQTVLWDVDGTLVDHAMTDQQFLGSALVVAGIDPSTLVPASIAAAQQGFVEGNLQWRTLEEESEQWGVLAETLLQGCETTAEQMQQVATRYRGYFDRFAEVAGMRKILERLSGRGVRQAVLSNWPPSLRNFLDHHDLTRYFDEIVVSAEEGVLKPDPQLFQVALDRLGLTPGEVLLIGDDPINDVEPARAMGMPVIHFNPRLDHSGADATDAAALEPLILAHLAA